jgi:hypothetical protein
MFENQGVKGILYMDDPRVMGGNFNVAETTKQVEAVKEKLTRGEWAGAVNTHSYHFWYSETTWFE